MSAPVHGTTTINPMSLLNKPQRAKSPTSTTSSAGSKRKRGTEPKFYAVRAGHKPGVYSTWADCLAQVKGFKNATFKSFATIADAESFLAGNDPSTDPGSASFGQQKYYAVHRGRVPGVYLDWPSAQKQITGWTKPKHRCFLTRAEAESFVRHGNQLASVSGDGLDEEPAIDVLSDSGLAHDGEQQQQQQQPSRRVMAHPEVVLLGSAAPSRAVAAAGEGAGAGVDTGGGVASPAKRPRKTNNNGSVNNSASKTAKAQAAAASSYDPSSTSVAAAVAVAAAAASLEHDTGDNFDPTTMLNPRSGKIVKKSEEQMRKTIMQPVGPKKDAVLRIYTDGSALNNGRGGAIGGVGVYFGDGDARNVSEPLKGDKQTNNRAELTAIVRALDIAPRNRAVCIYTDSSYSVNSLTHWVDGWRRNNWMGARGRPVENRDLIEAVLARIDERREQHGAMTQIQWLRGHDGDAGNTEADKLAVNGAKKAAAA